MTVFKIIFEVLLILNKQVFQIHMNYINIKKETIMAKAKKFTITKSKKKSLTKS